MVLAFRLSRGRFLCGLGKDLQTFVGELQRDIILLDTGAVDGAVFGGGIGHLVAFQDHIAVVIQELQLSGRAQSLHSFFGIADGGDLHCDPPVTGLVYLSFGEALEVQTLTKHIHNDFHVAAKLLGRHILVGHALKGDDGTAHQIQAQPHAVFGVGDAGDLCEAQIHPVPYCKAKQCYD